MRGIIVGFLDGVMALIAFLCALLGFLGAIATFSFLVRGHLLLAAYSCVATVLAVIVLGVKEDSDRTKTLGLTVLGVLASVAIATGATIATPVGEHLAAEWRRAWNYSDSLAPSSGESSTSEESNCDPNYSGCIPDVGYDLDCEDVSGTDIEVLGDDTNGFDRDDNGIGCESY